MSEAEQYARDLLKKGNEWKSGKNMKLAAQRFLNDLKRKDIYFDEDRANEMILFGEKYCVLFEGDMEGTPMVFLPWMKFVFQQIYGWYWKKDNKRRIIKCFLEVAKKNAKSTIIAIDDLFHLFADTQIKTPRVYTVASNKEQANIVVNMCGQIIKASPRLMKFVNQGIVKLYEKDGEINRIVHKSRNGVIRPLTKETDNKKGKTSGGKHGINASRGSVDECAMSPDPGAATTVSTSMASRDEPFMGFFTTASFNQDGYCYQELRKIGIDVLNGHVEDDGYLVCIFEMDAEDDWRDKKNWLKANPNLGVSVKERFLQNQVREAELKGGRTMVEVKTLNFNIWCESEEVWIAKEVWDENTHGYKLKDLKYIPECFGGIEIISGLGLNALVVLFPNINEVSDKDRMIHGILPVFWMPEGQVLPDANPMKVDFSKFVKDGHIITTPGNAIENDLIYRKIQEKIGEYRFNSGAFITHLENHDIVQALMKVNTWNPISKGYMGQSTPTKAWEELLTQRRIEHFGNPVLSWMNSNCMVLRKDNEIMLQRSGGKIAGIHACINALAQYETIEAQRPTDTAIETWAR